MTTSVGQFSQPPSTNMPFGHPASSPSRARSNFIPACPPSDGQPWEQELNILLDTNAVFGRFLEEKVNDDRRAELQEMRREGRKEEWLEIMLELYEERLSILQRLQDAFLSLLSAGFPRSFSQQLCFKKLVNTREDSAMCAARLRAELSRERIAEDERT